MRGKAESLGGQTGVERLPVATLGGGRHTVLVITAGAVERYKQDQRRRAGDDLRVPLEAHQPLGGDPAFQGRIEHGHVTHRLRVLPCRGKARRVHDVLDLFPCHGRVRKSAHAAASSDAFESFHKFRLLCVFGDFIVRRRLVAGRPLRMFHVEHFSARHRMIRWASCAARPLRLSRRKAPDAICRCRSGRRSRAAGLRRGRRRECGRASDGRRRRSRRRAPDRDRR